MKMGHTRLLLLCTLLLLYASALSSSETPELLQGGLQRTLDKRQTDSLPLLNLSYATYRASSYNSEADIYTFKNIRFAAPPVGNLRWRKPQPPETVAGIQDGSEGSQCIQSTPSLLGLPLTSIYPSTGNGEQSEDCLFLDLYVPGKAIRAPEQYTLPVVVWIFGGAYISGSKDQIPTLFYDGTGPISTSGGNIIFIAGNYRLGAYGFLAGDTMEKEGLPNAGLHDQRAVFQWARDNARKFGGDASQVSAWGESAGAGSIFHLLVAEGGTLDPMFNRAITQSAAYQSMFDRKGLLEQTFQNFSSFAGCSGSNVDCLRAASAETLEDANNKLQSSVVPGTFATGPAADGTFIRQLAVLEYASGNYWKSLNSTIISHVASESTIFTPVEVQTDKQFTDFVAATLPSYASSDGIITSIDNFYPPPSLTGPYQTQSQRLSTLLRDESFTCNQRSLTLAYQPNTWNLQYSITPGLHATDLIPLFYNTYVNVSALLGKTGTEIPVVPYIGNLAKTYQSYATSHARTGNPNSDISSAVHQAVYPAIQWPHPGDLQQEELSNVLHFQDTGLELVKDDQVLKSHCDFLQQVAIAETNLGGYAPPNAVLQQKGGTNGVATVVAKKPSRNYVNQCSECREGTS